MWPRFLSIVLLIVALVPAAGAQELLSGDEQNLANAGFATQLGSGVYSVSGRTLQIYRLPFDYTLRDAGPSHTGIELTLPVTLGFFDFELRDVADQGLPTSIDSVSFVPGLRFRRELQRNWHLEPYAEAGVARAGDIDATVYSAGLTSLYDFGAKGFDWLLRNDLTYAAVDLRGRVGSDHFTRLQTVLMARRTFTRESSADYLVYALNDLYLEQPGGPIDSAERRGRSMQYEFGVTLGTTDGLRLWRIPLPRLGLGYRFGSGIGVVRIVFGAPY